MNTVRKTLGKVVTKVCMMALVWLVWGCGGNETPAKATPSWCDWEAPYDYDLKLELLKVTGAADCESLYLDLLQPADFVADLEYTEGANANECNFEMSHTVDGVPFVMAVHQQGPHRWAGDAQARIFDGDKLACEATYKVTLVGRLLSE
jgi:hypothetical protein